MDPRTDLETFAENREHMCPQKLPNRVFALEGLHFQGFQHFQKLAKIPSKWRLNSAKNQENVVQRPLKNSLEKHIKKHEKCVQNTSQNEVQKSYIFEVC